MTSSLFVSLVGSFCVGNAGNAEVFVKKLSTSI